MRKTEIDGIVCGHDFQMKKVRRAVEEYCKNYDRLLKTWGGEWWFISGMRTDTSRESLVE